MVTTMNSTQVLKDLPIPPGIVPSGMVQLNPTMTSSH